MHLTVTIYISGYLDIWHTLDTPDSAMAAKISTADVFLQPREQLRRGAVLWSGAVQCSGVVQCSASEWCSARNDCYAK